MDDIERAQRLWTEAKEALHRASQAVLRASGDQLRAAEEAFLTAYYEEEAARNLFEGLVADVKADDLATGEFRRVTCLPKAG